MEAYTAVHSKEAKEELNSQRDPISEMNTASLQDNDLRELAEEVLEEVFKTSTVKEAEDIIFNMIPESNIVGREEKLERIYAAFGETFSRIKLKDQSGQLEDLPSTDNKRDLKKLGLQDSTKRREFKEFTAQLLLKILLSSRRVCLDSLRRRKVIPAGLVTSKLV